MDVFLNNDIEKLDTRTVCNVFFRAASIYVNFISFVSITDVWIPSQNSEPGHVCVCYRYRFLPFFHDLYT